MSALLESAALDNNHDQAEFQEITDIVSQQHAQEICCVCQASILQNFFKFFSVERETYFV